MKTNRAGFLPFALLSQRATHGQTLIGIMLKPTSLKELPRYPVTALLAGTALGVTTLWWTGQNIDGCFMDGRVWSQWELWRAFTSIFPHVDIFHLAFNIYWLWVFGPIVERAFGHVRFAAMALLLSVVPAFAEFSLFSGGVGLSGLGYGLWGLLWVLQHHDPRFADTVDARTSRLFVGWFFFCILLTASKIMPIGNIAHGVGAIMGALIGWATSTQRISRAASIAGIALISLLSLAGSTIGWPHINRTEFAQAEVERAGVEALNDRENARAVKLLRLSVHMKAAPARAWYNLGVAYQRSGDLVRALTAYEHAARMPEADEQIQKTAREMKKYISSRESNRKK